jgi:hypothetical protein
MPRVTFIATLTLLALSGGSTVVFGAELGPSAAANYAAYFERAAAAFIDRALNASPGGTPDRAALLRAGQVLTEPGSGDGILSGPDSLVHHWRGDIFIPGVTLDQVVELSQSYAEYPRIFHPVKRASVLAGTADGFRVQFRMRQSGGGLSATLDVRTRVQYVRPRGDRAYVVSRSEEIREVKNPDGPNEYQLPEGKDSGYLWRAGALTQFVAVPGGVFMAMETVGMSRPFPPLLGWLIEPVARRIGRQSVEESMREFKQAVIARNRAGA